jgi:GTPase SAR1 family protein
MEITVQRYKILLVGPVGAGKTTLLHHLHNFFNNGEQSFDIPKWRNLKYIQHVKDKHKTNIIPEFADSPIGLTILQEFLAGRASAITLQNYVIDFWSNHKLNNELITLYDRCPDDALYCFCNIRNNSGEIDDFAFMSLMERTKELNHYYPHYFSPENKFLFIRNDNLQVCLNETLTVIDNDLMEMQENNSPITRVICLEVTDDECISRVKSRNRNGESGYSEETLKSFNRHYHKLYKYMKTHKEIRMLDIGKLL